VKETLVEDKFDFRIRFTYGSDEDEGIYGVNVETWEIMATNISNEPEGTVYLQLKESKGRSGDYTTKEDEAESYLKAWIKWDGCSHVNFANEETEEPGYPYGYIHMCGSYAFINHVNLLRYIFGKSMELMGRQDEDTIPGWEVPIGL